MKMFVAEMQAHPGRQAASLGAMGVDELRWLRPVRPGDTLRGRSEVIDKKASQSRPEMGIVRNKVSLQSQNVCFIITLGSPGQHPNLSERILTLRQLDIKQKNK